MFRLPVLLLSILSYGVAGLRKGTQSASRGKSKGRARRVAAAAEAAAEYDDYGSDGSEQGDQCVSNWTDSQKFDCQLYEGAGWCSKNSFLSMGYGWCNGRRQNCDNTPIGQGGWALSGDSGSGWGTFIGFANQNHPFTARQVCEGCGANCPKMARTRPLNEIKDGCVDYSAPNGQIWRGPSGYSCGAYHYGGYCRYENGRWVNGDLMQGYGRLETYTHWAMKGDEQMKMNPLQACCSCGGGCQCTSGWMPAEDTQCQREFQYNGKGYSGCTTVTNPQVEGGGAWCAHHKTYQSGAFSRCVPCEAGWQPKLGSSCTSEFTFNGTSYGGCTRRAGETGAWCAHDSVARGDRWSKCEQCS